jgi:hypothetical protein
VLVLGWSPNTRTLRAVDGQRGRNLRLDWVVKAMALGRDHAVSKWAPGRVDPCDHGVLDRRSWAALIASSWIGSCNHAQRGLAGFESEACSPCCKAAARNRITGGGGQSATPSFRTSHDWRGIPRLAWVGSFIHTNMVVT